MISPVHRAPKGKEDLSSVKEEPGLSLPEEEAASELPRKKPDPRLIASAQDGPSPAVFRKGAPKSREVRPVIAWETLKKPMQLFNITFPEGSKIRYQPDCRSKTLDCIRDAVIPKGLSLIVDGTPHTFDDDYAVRKVSNQYFMIDSGTIREISRYNSSTRRWDKTLVANPRAWSPEPTECDWATWAQAKKKYEGTPSRKELEKARTGLSYGIASRKVEEFLLAEQIFSALPTSAGPEGRDIYNVAQLHLADLELEDTGTQDWQVAIRLLEKATQAGTRDLSPMHTLFREMSDAVSVSWSRDSKPDSWERVPFAQEQFTTYQSHLRKALDAYNTMKALSENEKTPDDVKEVVKSLLQKVTSILSRLIMTYRSEGEKMAPPLAKEALDQELLKHTHEYPGANCWPYKGLGGSQRPPTCSS